MLRSLRCWTTQTWITSLALGMATLGVSQDSHAFGEKKNEEISVMGVLGDSISAASFSQIGLSPFYVFPFTKPSGASELALESPELSRSSEFSPKDFSEITSDAEIKKRLEASSLLSNKKTLSWASGEYVNSHYKRLKNTRPDETFKVINVAIPASKAKLLNFQADLLVTAMKLGHYKELKYVTVMVGAVDACAWDTKGGTPNDQVTENLFQVFKKLSTLKQEHPIHVLVEGVPKVPDLAKAEIWNTRLLNKWSCEKIQTKLFKFCNSLLVWKTPEEYQERVAIVEGKNRAIEAAVSRAQDELRNLDIHFDNSFFEESIHVDELAADCFHPNIKGQERISKVLWSKQPWF